MDIKELLSECFKEYDCKISALTILNYIKLAYLQAVESSQSDSIVFIESVGLSLSEYNYGKHRSAYDLFETAMSYIDIDSLIRPLGVTSLFRLRNKQTFEPKEMFHIPFEDRYKVGTQRYSFPGLPCLYMGSSIDVCKEEVFGSKDIESQEYSIAQYRVNNENSPKILDLSYFFDLDFDYMNASDRTIFMKILPLIALCSVRCSYPVNEKIGFRTEYIIPQMLLQYIMDSKHFKTGEVIGIKYRSVYHMHDIWNDETKKDKWNNYVFPAISNHTTGLSKLLEETFPFVGFVV